MGEFIWGRYALWAYMGLAMVIFAGLSVIIHPYFLSATLAVCCIIWTGIFRFFSKEKRCSS